MAHVATSYYTQLLTSANTVRTIWMLFVCYLSQSTLTSIATNLRWQSEGNQRVKLAPKIVLCYIYYETTFKMWKIQRLREMLMETWL